MILLKLYLAPEQRNAKCVETISSTLESSLNLCLAPTDIATEFVATHLNSCWIECVAIYAEGIFLRAIEREVYSRHYLLLRLNGILRIIVSLASYIESIRSFCDRERRVSLELCKESLSIGNSLIEIGSTRISISGTLLLG